MIDLIKSISKKIGIDAAIAYTILARIIQAGGGVITLLFVARYLTKVEQGYYYTFGSILAIHFFMETSFFIHIARKKWFQKVVKKNLFIKKVSFHSTWIANFGFWREDFEKLDKNINMQDCNLFK